MQYRHELLAPAPSEGNYLTEEEVATVRDVINKWKDHSREEIVAASHGEPPWLLTEFGEDIDYDTVFYRRNVDARDDEEPDPMPIGPSPYWRST